ncbi:MAG: 30S ribosomal protein S1 [Tissierellia bacterium]|nr:30S ribosomal protein S1 [Tissierellia bacterium]
MDNLTNEEFMEQVEDSMIRIYPKDIVKGTVINVKDTEVFVDIRYRSDGIIKLDEMSKEEALDPTKAFEEGQEIDVFVIKLDDGEGNVALSTRRVEGLKNWKKLLGAYEQDEVVQAEVTGENTGGLVVNVMGINGFIPASQITTYFVKNFKQFVGQTLDCKIISIDEKKKRVVLSSKVILEEKLDKVWEKIIVGEKITGKVVRLVDFGAFVDLGGVDALIHVSDISWDRIEKPSDVLEVGQEVEALVLKANREKNRVSLGLKQLQEKPFDLFLKNNKVGDVVKGKVVNLLDFGAFVRLEEGVEGLVHVSQVSNEHVEKPSDVLNIGDEVEVKILEVDQEQQRISLSMRALMEPKEAVRENKSFERKERPKKERRERKVVKEQTQDKFSDDNTFGTNFGELLDGLNLDEELISEEENTEE